ncbi:type II toxin-antitoxin system VapC family toxin [Rhizobium sp. TH2]|uniref:type II toxin-antitoxin system VapC family toxin n=1 Tax=Rhizobium sp. TH2 TaxID=2775403 RepID=UPI0021582EB2|nr:type II toxin-antitoxin system VapC family toxin [Rhizobium sp. TH2]UVC08167.1 type II toxin-antitoxin system VapC family toxin [Rhizobium sp. TH2]
MIVVPDASVFNKLFLDEPDRQHAVALFEHCSEAEIDLVAPDILRYEVMSVAMRFGIPFAFVYHILDIQRSAGLRLLEPSLKVLQRAETIATSGHEKSGYPDLHDSIYHALALELNGIFVTADHRHFAKAKAFGAMTLLEDWRDALGLTQR